MAEVKLSDIKPNSDISRRQTTDSIEKKKVTKIVTGKVETAEVSVWKKLIGAFVEEDLATVAKYLVKEMIIPGIKDSILDGIGMMLGVDSRYVTSAKAKVRKEKDYASYNAYHKYGSGNYRRDDSDDGDSGYDYRRIILESKGEAELVLDSLSELINEYDQASIADLYELVGITGRFTDNKWGWFDLDGAKARRISGGRYVIEMPKARPLD